MKAVSFSVFHFLILSSFSLVRFSISYSISTKNRTAIEQLTYDLEFSKDIASVLTEATLESKCDGNVFITTKGCTDYLDYMLNQMSEWAPPVLLVTYQDHKKIGNFDVWARFLAWKKRPCSIVFVCDLMRMAEQDQMYGRGDDQILENLISSDEDDIGHLKLPKFIESPDQVLYFTDYIEEFYEEDAEVVGNNRSNSDASYRLTNMNNIQSKILKQSGILMQIVVENRSDTEPEALMHVYSICEYCGHSSKWQQRDLGYWQRNKTLFGKFFHVFDDFHKLSFNQTNLNIGYFNHPPHFSCYSDQSSNLSLIVEDYEGGEGSYSAHEMPTKCEGVEWEMISQMGKSLDFTTTWINLSNPEPGQGYLGEANNISIMIASFEAEKIDLAVGGISVTPKRVQYVDFSSVFANDPIVFVVQKKSDLFALGIWLAFNPEIWPLMFLLIAIISLLFHIIIYQYTLEPPNKTRRLALSSYLHEVSHKKSIHVAIFEALEITLQPLIGQPLSTSQITHRPRRLLKLVLIIWWFSCLIISTLYNTSLITSLINPISPKEAEQLQDLLDFGYLFKPAGKQGAFFEMVKGVIDDLPDVDDEEQYTPEGQTTTNEEKKTVKLIKQISDRLITDGSSKLRSSQVAYVIEESAAKGIKWDKKEIGFSQIKVIRERLFLTTYAWPTQRHAAFKKKIDAALGRLNSAGLVEYWYHQFGHRDNSKERSSLAFRLREKLGQINLNMQVLQGAFIFLIFGHGFGALLFVIEHLTKRYRFRFFTWKEIFRFCRKLIRGIKKIYGKHFASEHEDLQLRRKKNRLRFRGVVRTVASFKSVSKDIPFLK